MSQTPNLSLPYIAPAQAQKHVTHNEAIRALDAIVQLSAASRATVAQPTSPADGDRYILPAGKTGADWGAMPADSIAGFQDGAWTEIPPREGFVAWVADEDKLYAYDGSAWVVTSSGVDGDAQPQRINGLTPHESLTVSTVSVSTVDIDAKAVTLFDSSDIAVRVTGVNLTADINMTGANGLDTGSEATSTWYHLWLIHNGTTTASLLSTSETAPTLPGGYTSKGYIGAIFNDASSDFININQQGSRVGRSYITVLSGGTAITGTSIDLSVSIPPNAKTVILETYIYKSSGTSSVSSWISSNNFVISTTYTMFIISPSPIVSGSTNSIVMAGSGLLEEAQTIYYKVGGPNAATNIIVMGWEY